MTTNDPTCLLLHLGDDGPVWEEDCGCCSKGKYRWVGSTIEDGKFGPFKKSEYQQCEACHGTGKRRYRLTGDVEVEFDCIVGHSPYFHIVGTKLCGHKSQVIKDIIAAFRSGTLPEAVKARLRKEDVE